jgi:hypothetical protein
MRVDELLETTNALGIAQAALIRTDVLETRLQGSDAGIAELRGEVRELVELFGRFVPTVAEQISAMVLIPLLQNCLPIGSSFSLSSKPDPLALDSLIEQAKTIIPRVNHNARYCNCRQADMRR